MIDKISAVVCDIDRTLVEKGGKLMPITKKAIERLHKEGIKFGVASGRPLDHRLIDSYKFWELDFPFDVVIGMNGGDLWDINHPEIEHYKLLDKESVREILTFLKPLDLNAIVYENAYDSILCFRIDPFMQDSIERNHSYVTAGDFERMCAKDTGKIEVHYKPQDEEEILKVINEHKSDKWATVKTFIGTVEFVNPELHKGVALEKYAERNNIPLSEILACGDEENDYGLIKTAGYGVCMENGCDKCKEIADAVTEYPVEEDGFGKFVFEHYFKESY